MESTSNIAPTHSQSVSLPILWKTRWVGAAGFLPLLLFTWIPNSYSYMVGWPHVLIWQGGFFTIVSYICWLCRKFSIPFRRLGYGLDHGVILITTAATLSTITAEFKAVACWNLLLIANYVVCLYFLTNFLRHRLITHYSLWALLSATGVVTSIIGLTLWRPDPSMWLSTDFYSAIRNSQPLGHHNFVGGYELLLLPIVSSFALSQKGWRKWICIVALAIVAIALYVSGSRGALVGLLTVGIVSIGLGLAVSTRQNRRRWAITGCCFALVMLLALASNPRIRTLFSVDPAAEKDTVSIISISDGPTKDRIFMAESALNILKARPILGVGPGTLSRVYNLYRPIEAGTGLNLVQQLHNTPAQIAAELGLFGSSSCVVLLFFLLRIGFLLSKSITKHKDRLLLYGIFASWTGYGISSLTDYQLENIGITTTLLVTTALLVSLADTYPGSIQRLELSNRQRRITSLCFLVLLCANLQMWARVNTGFYLSNSAIQDTHALEFTQADIKWSKASRIVPWEPSYPAIAAEAALKLIPDANSEEDAKELRAMATAYFKSAVKAAPNDPWFQQNLAVLFLNTEPREAEKHARQSVELSPRNHNNYTYYTLGLAYLKQGLASKAVDAFVLESLANPIFLIGTMWEEEPLLSMRRTVVGRSLEAYRQVLSTTNPLSSQYKWLHNQLVILSWWYGYPVSAEEKETIGPLINAFLAADDNPKKALDLIDTHIQEVGYSSDIHLVQARLSPEKYLPSLLEKLDGTEEERANLTRSIKSNQSMQSWLSEVTENIQGTVRTVTIFAYRTLAANHVRRVLSPEDIHVPILPSAIGLFPDAPREYPQLDHYMLGIRTNQLAIK